MNWCASMRRGLLAMSVVAAVTAPPALHGQALPETLKACTRIVSDSERLACFDRQMATLERARTGATAVPPQAAVASVPSAPASAAVAGTAPAGAGASTTAPPATGSQLSPEQRFGLTPSTILGREGKAQPPISGMVAHIASVSSNSSGRKIITLDNGQIWRQAEARDFNAEPGQAVTLSTGTLGSYWLATGKHNWTRVERAL